MVKVKKHPDVEYRCILGRHCVAVPVVGWHCGGRLTGRERGGETGSGGGRQVRF